MHVDANMVHGWPLLLAPVSACSLDGAFYATTLSGGPLHPIYAPYRDPGPDYYDRRHAQRVTRRAIELLERQGYRVVLEPAA